MGCPLPSMFNSLLPPANEVWSKVIFSVVCVKNSVHRGVCLSACWDTTPPWQGRTPLARRPPLARQIPPGKADPPWQGDSPGKGRPPWQGRPPAQCMLGDTVNKRAVCILLECNLVFGFVCVLFTMDILDLVQP